MARRGVRTSQTQWMRMALSRRVDRSRSIKEDRRMTIRGETSGADVARGICLTPLSILISKLSIMVRHLKEQILHNFKQAVAEEDLARSTPKQISKRKIEWTL